MSFHLAFFAGLPPDKLTHTNITFLLYHTNFFPVHHPTSPCVPYVLQYPLASTCIHLHPLASPSTPHITFRRGKCLICALNFPCGNFWCMKTLFLTPNCLVPSLPVREMPHLCTIFPVRQLFVQENTLFYTEPHRADVRPFYWTVKHLFNM